MPLSAVAVPWFVGPVPGWRAEASPCCPRLCSPFRAEPTPAVLPAPRVRGAASPPALASSGCHEGREVPRLSLRGERGGVPPPSVAGLLFERLWETAALLFCPEHHNLTVGYPPAPRAGGRAGLAVPVASVGTAALLQAAGETAGGPPAPRPLCGAGGGAGCSRGA